MVSAATSARERGMQVEELTRGQEGAFESYIRFTVRTERFERSVAGTVFSDGRPRIIQVRDIDMEFELARRMLFIRNEDKPGFIGRFGTLMGEAGLNIATLNLGRDKPGGDAICMVAIDEPASDEVAAPPAATAEPITAANWQRHPAIAEIRAIYRDIRQAETAGRLRKEERSFGYCRAYEDSERALYRDAGGAVRSYHVGRGSDDSAVQVAYYYDGHGALRFVFAKAGAVNDSSYEYRIYLARSGERLWQERRHLKGPGYSFPSELPDDWLVRDPRQAFEAAHPCEKP
jgi:hypothetical protein